MFQYPRYYRPIIFQDGLHWNIFNLQQKIHCVFIDFSECVVLLLPGRRERGQPPPLPPPHHFLEQNRKTEHFYMWITFETLFIKKDISDKNYIAFSEFVVLAVNWATAVTNNEFVSFLFLIETFVKTNSNLMCGSF